MWLVIVIIIKTHAYAIGKDLVDHQGVNVITSFHADTQQFRLDSMRTEPTTIKPYVEFISINCK